MWKFTLVVLVATLPLLAQADLTTVDRLNAAIDKGSPVLDYVLQDVCVDVSDRIVSGDPATCERHRNVRIGEKIPYLRTDFDRRYGNRTYQALWSYPVPGADGSLKVMVLKTNIGSFGPDYAMPPYDVTRDGYDLLDTSGSHVSGIRTSDGGCFDQKIDGPGARNNGWIFFKQDLGTSSLVHSIAMTRISADVPSSCGAYLSRSQSDNAYDVWNSPSPTTFETGKTLNAIVTYHYANKDLKKDFNSMERYFFTKEYGFTRWEAWVTLKGCQRDMEAKNPGICNPSAENNMLTGRCGGSSPIPATATFGRQSWVRVDCRDSTNYIALNKPLIPLYQPSRDFAGLAENDNLKDVDSQSVFDAVARGPITSPSRPTSNSATKIESCGTRCPLPGGTYLLTCGSCTATADSLSCYCKNTRGKWFQRRSRTRAVPAASTTTMAISCATALAVSTVGDLAR